MQDLYLKNTIEVKINFGQKTLEENKIQIIEQDWHLKYNLFNCSCFHKKQNKNISILGLFYLKTTS